MTLESTRKKTITDFGDQWDIHGKIEDEWTSEEKFRDHFGNIFDPNEINSKIVCDVGLYVCDVEYLYGVFIWRILYVCDVFVM